MHVTEDQAKSKKCPLTACTTRCIASDCMAWRWTEFMLFTAKPGTDPRETGLDELPLSPRARYTLAGHGYGTVADICAASDAELLQIPNFGIKTLKEVRLTLGRNPVDSEKTGFCGAAGNPQREGVKRGAKAP